MPLPFSRRLRVVQQELQSVVCVGLDPDLERLPPHLLRDAAPADAVLAFNRVVIDATAAYACAYKLNFAFYEALGADGWRVLRETAAHVPDAHLVVADAKRGDIGNTARFYARSVFDELGCDAVTVAPYMGRDSVTPFLEHEGRAAFVLARTSNPGAADLQERVCDGAPLYEHVARQVAAWSDAAAGEAGLVAGATDLASLRRLRELCPRLPFLIPGVGAQGGDAAAVMQAAASDEGPVLVNSSRGILYASAERDFAEAAARAARELRDRLNGA